MTDNASLAARLRALEPVWPGLDSDPSPLSKHDYVRLVNDPDRGPGWFQYLHEVESYKIEARKLAEQYEQHTAALLREGQELQGKLNAETAKATMLKTMLEEAYEKRLSDKQPVTPVPAPKTSKLPDTAMFNGDRAKVEYFIAQLRLKLNGNKDHFPTPQLQLSYAITRLEGQAMAQVLPKISHGGIDFEDIEALFDFLRKAFGDPDRKATAKRELFLLRQTHKEFAVFIAEFSRLAAESELHEDALGFALGQAISGELRELMLHHQIPEDYQDYVDLLQGLDSRMRANQAINKRAIRPVFKPTYSPSGPSSPSPSSHSVSPASTPSSISYLRTPSTAVTPLDSASNLGSGPMDLSVARAPTTPAEKDRRRALGLCSYCGGPGHSADVCPRLKCFNCQGQGHIAKFCTQPRRQRIHEITVEEMKTEESEKE